MANPSHTTALKKLVDGLDAEQIAKLRSMMAREGGLARAAKYSQEQLSAWGKKGGRPKKEAEHA